MSASYNPLKLRLLRCKLTQNAHLLTCRLRFFASLRLAIISLIEL